MVHLNWPEDRARPCNHAGKLASRMKLRFTGPRFTWWWRRNLLMTLGS